MFEHIGLLTLRPEATPADVDRIAEGLLALRGTVPGLKTAEVFRDAGLSEGNAALMFRMGFATQRDWESYRTHPAHVAVIHDRIAPVLASKAFVQLDERAPVAAAPAS
jgi:hypothetical protein